MTDIQPNQRKALEAILSGDTIERAAIHADVHERTVYRWLSEDDNFKQALNEKSDELIRGAMIALSGAAIEAIQVLRQVMTDIETPASTKVSAARAIIDSTLRIKEMHELSERVSELESRLAS